MACQLSALKFSICGGICTTNSHGFGPETKSLPNWFVLALIVCLNVNTFTT